MTHPHTPAAGQGGDPSAPENPSQVPETPNPRMSERAQPPEDDDLESDESLRRRAATCMAHHLESASNLIERCEYLTLQPKGDRLRPLHAAARLLQADAKVAQALGQLALVERRQHTIVERVQPPAPVLKDSKSSFANLDPHGALIEALMDKMLRYMALVAEETLDPALKEAAENARAKENSAAATEATEAPA